MLSIDGTAGGGQILRWALAFATATGQPVRVENVRGSRPTPGLKPQHLAATTVLASITDAEVTGAHEGSEEVTFDPGPVAPGDYDIDVGTAGSLTLVFDTVLALAPVLSDRITVSATGGTDVKWSPSMAYFRAVKLPFLARHGIYAAVDVDRRGFYPAGGGRARLSVFPPDPSLTLLDRPPVERARVYSTASTDLADADVARRQAEAATERLRAAGVDVTERVVRSVDTRSTGSAVAVRLDCGEVLAGFDTLGARGKPAEDVGTEAASAASAFLGGSATVDEHMADQLVPYLALSGGQVTIPRVTDHVATGVDLAREFGFDVRIDDSGTAPVLVGDGDPSQT